MPRHWIFHPQDFPRKNPGPKSSDLEQLSILQKAKQYKESNPENCNVEKFFHSIKYSQEDISNINEHTQGQATNEAWYEMRVGLLTASNFRQASKYIDDGKEPCKSFMQNVMGVTNYQHLCYLHL
jgi:hypothetical protein